MTMNNGVLYNKKQATEIILEYLANFPESPSKTLAKKIYSDHPTFSSFEAVYGRVRYYRGQLGTQHRKNLKDKTFQKELKIEYTMKEKFLPESYANRRETFVFPTGCKTLGIIGDVHIPYQDNDAIEVAFTKMEEEGIDSLYINGDLLDFYQLSFHEKDPRMVHFKQEIEAGRQFLDYCRSRFPNIPIYLIPGNHENTRFGLGVFEHRWHNKNHSKSCCTHRHLCAGGLVGTRLGAGLSG